jgi:ribonuclease III
MMQKERNPAVIWKLRHPAKAKQKKNEDEFFALWGEKSQFKTVMRQLEKKAGVVFKDRFLLFEALTHKSAVYGRTKGGVTRGQDLSCNERLEFLGDAVLGLAISTELMKRFPNHPEGELSKMRASLVNEDSLATTAKKLDLGSCLLLGKGEKRAGGREKPSLLANTFEAFLGAIFLDRGFAVAQKLVNRLFSNTFEGEPENLPDEDFKTRLQELTQGLFHAIPQYNVEVESGPDHNKMFEVTAVMGGEVIGHGEGPSKKKASQMAAKNAFLKLSSSQKKR